MNRRNRIAIIKLKKTLYNRRSEFYAGFTIGIILTLIGIAGRHDFIK